MYSPEERKPEMEDTREEILLILLLSWETVPLLKALA